MIRRITGRICGVEEECVWLDVLGVWLELLTPASGLPELQRRVGSEITLHTILYLEGALGGGNLTPRLIGFLSEPDRRFFDELTRVKGISTRKALRLMGAPTHLIAAAIERGDERFLTTLPEIGKKTAAGMIAELRGRLTPFCAGEPQSAPLPELNTAQQLALEILMQWGDRRADAQRWIAAAVEADGLLAEPDEIVRAAYRVKRSIG
ncbi:MAG: hypothetical protein IPM64_12950 [Phycisphaerales bacterium]|nr:hypothetical protein [Phycisphaerales bacterium]